MVKKYVQLGDVLKILENYPRDKVQESIFNLKGVWLDESEKPKQHEEIDFEKIADVADDYNLDATITIRTDGEVEIEFTHPSNMTRATTEYEYNHQS